MDSEGAYGVPMQWEDLIADLEAQMDSAQEGDWRAEVAERTRGERASILLAERVAAGRGAGVRVTLRGGARVGGTVVDSGSDWMLLGEQSRRRLVPLAAAAVIEGLPQRTHALSRVEERLSLASTLRALARDRARVRISAGVDLTGVIAAVGADHVDLATEARQEVTVPLTAIVEVCSL